MLALAPAEYGNMPIVVAIPDRHHALFPIVAAQYALEFSFVLQPPNV